MTATLGGWWKSHKSTQFRCIMKKNNTFKAVMENCIPPNIFRIGSEALGMLCNRNTKRCCAAITEVLQGVVRFSSQHCASVVSGQTMRVGTYIFLQLRAAHASLIVIILLCLGRMHVLLEACCYDQRLYEYDNLSNSVPWTFHTKNEDSFFT